MQKQLLKPVAFIACLLPLIVLGWQLYAGLLGANPIDEVADGTGEWALRFLLIMLGLYAFFYASLHLLTYLWLDQFFDWGEIWLDILDRPFITVGMLAFVLLIPLAVTSNRFMVRRLGGKWKRLHQLAYVIPALGVLHFWWLVKADVLEPLLYGVVLVVLLGSRVKAGSEVNNTAQNGCVS
jgi:sulfoxide reductase heme-binding subunit YedZ